MEVLTLPVVVCCLYDRVQLTMCLGHVLGATGCLGGMALALAAQLAGLQATTWWPPTLLSALVQLLALALIGDFGLYWGKLPRSISWVADVCLCRALGAASMHLNKEPSSD